MRPLPRSRKPPRGYPGSLRTPAPVAIQRARLAGFPLPAFLLPKAQIREYEKGGAFHFDVALHALLTGGLIVQYRGTVAADT